MEKTTALESGKLYPTVVRPLKIMGLKLHGVQESATMQCYSASKVSKVITLVAGADVGKT